MLLLEHQAYLGKKKDDVANKVSKIICTLFVETLINHRKVLNKKGWQE